MKKQSPTFSRQPLFVLAAFFSLGIAAAGFYPLDWKIYLAVCLSSAVLSVVFLKRKAAAAFLLLAFFAAGAFCFQTKDQTVDENRLKRLYDENKIPSGDPLEIEGVLQTKPERAPGGFFLELKAEKLFYKNQISDVSGKLSLFAAASDGQAALEYEALGLRYGSRVRVACRPTREEQFLNPGVVSRKEILDRREIDAAAVIKSPLLIEKLGEEKIFAPLGWIYERRANLIGNFKDKFSVSTAGVLIASLLGNRHFLDRPTAAVFREGGTFHVLVISGLHITFIGGLTLVFVRFFTRSRWRQFFVASCFLWAYSAAVGADVPVVRAALMFTVLLFSQVIYREANLLNALGAAALALLVWRPEDLFGQSFQLTMVSVTAIVAGAFPLIEKLREIGGWMPSAEKPFPPRAGRFLKSFCETLYWREALWAREQKRQVWSARLYKTPYLKWLEARSLQSVFRYLFESLLVSLVVQIWLLPLSVLYFHRVAFSAVVLNLWVGFFIALESFAAVAALFLGVFSETAALPVVRLTELFNSLLLFLPELFIAFDLAGFRVPVYTGAGRAVYFLYFLPLLVLTFFINGWKPFERVPPRKTEVSDPKKERSWSEIFEPAFLGSFTVRAAALVLIFLVALVVFHPFSAPAPDGRLHMEFLDVGQGDAALVTFPNGETLLIDGGGRVGFRTPDDEGENGSFEPDRPRIGEAVVSQFLWEKGLSRIDYILATHADADHIQGLKDVAENFEIGAAFFGRMPFEENDFAALYGVLQRKKAGIIEVSRGDELEIGGVRLQILHPRKTVSSEPNSGNNDSVVLRLIYGTKKFLFTGDIEKEAEAELLGNPAFLRADLVKVAHHGSRTSSTEGFIRATGAEYAIIPVGRKSMFGHPHREVVERWLASGAKIKQTGDKGMISVSTDGRDLVIETFRK